MACFELRPVFGEFLLPLRSRLKRLPKRGGMTPRLSLPCLPYPSIRGPTGLATINPLEQVRLIGSVTQTIASFEMFGLPLVAGP